ncbi:hypothetical protein INT43_008444 [Umbelopsis isabellina]|uniref:Uncharacterized protein n=1 Tax=Mortierella isabellina TaxID=91625 RepID=A0A8H7PVX5_MORIS|nr:hypothetical protein INT43_008444 [Umbelopsis isabellina]
MQKPDAFLEAEAEPEYEPMKPDTKDQDDKLQIYPPLPDHKQEMRNQIESNTSSAKQTSRQPSFFKRLSKRTVIIAVIILCIIIFVAAFVPAFLKTHQNHNDSSSNNSILPVNNSVYTIQIANGRAGCNQYLSVSTCQIGNNIQMWSNDDGSGRQHFTFQLVPNKTNVYNIFPNGRSGCDDYLSSASCGFNYVDVWGADDGSGRQQWTALPIPNTTNQFNFLIENGRNGCNDYLSTADCTNSSNLVDLFGVDDGSGRQRWNLTLITQ